MSARIAYLLHADLPAHGLLAGDVVVPRRRNLLGLPDSPGELVLCREVDPGLLFILADAPEAQPILVPEPAAGA